MNTIRCVRTMFVLACLGLTACVAVGPDYVPPVADVPATWSMATDNQGQAAEPGDLSRWWEEFNDPVLNDLVTDALTANLDLATARAQLREARAQRALAGSQLGPSVDVATSASRSQSSEESGSGSTSELYSAGFDASWEADVFGGLRRGVEAAAADVDASVESLRDTQVSLVAEVVLNYVDLRTAERRLSVAENNIASLSETYRLAGWRLQAGLVSELDVAQARTELESTRASLPALRTTRAEARNRLAVLLGSSPAELGSRLESAGAIPLAERAAAVGIPADILRQRPDVRAAERQLAAQTARLGEAEAERYPSFKLSGSIGLEALTLSALSNGGAAVYSLLGSITAPIFDSGRIRANIETQDALLEQTRLAYKAAVLTALEDVENALVAVNNAGKRRETLTLAADSARETLQLAEQRYAGGLVDFLTVLDSQRTLLGLEDDLASSAGDLAGAQIQLYKALGGGWSPEPQTEDNRDAS
ncbi:efflux pump, RND family, outer membrane lipoprotein [Syntrophotalea carbinolica DSM 2380]|uniref:Efflux pump, RND family, outer membrane lipoprotein n=1 Tax=Syntrophotalea carbinolica (strain DSM 2380 / NBRC 103641 / GraBd1) TaxID=338963 RepID=Q3A6D6_SYNC1|nr:efflux transporter outer membrane subunit [Syntrophotalea carbinolica]ABA88071.1 efflux pump, RND family, outer membrane lipoprotein [Syntrophotalea carbinolica DSM 2380]